MAPENGKRKEKILAVDDDPLMRRLYSRFLSDHYDVDTAGDGKEALKMIFKVPYSAVICDYNMPNMNGKQLYEELCLLMPQMTKKMIYSFTSVSNEQMDFISENKLTYVPKPASKESILRSIDDILNNGKSE